VILSLEMNFLLPGMVLTNFQICLQKNLVVSDINIVCTLNVGAVIVYENSCYACFMYLYISQ